MYVLRSIKLNTKKIFKGTTFMKHGQQTKFRQCLMQFRLEYIVCLVLLENVRLKIYKAHIHVVVFMGLKFCMSPQWTDTG
jgi:hypothetical protein